MNLDPVKQINKAKIQLFTEKNTTFWSTLLAQLRIVWSEDIPTAAVDGKTLWLNKDFITKLSSNPAHVLFLLLHEVYHVALKHMDRRASANLDPAIYNAAGDYVINGDLVRRGYQMPSEGLHDHKYDGWSTRQVYDDLLENNPGIECPLDVVFCEPEDSEAHNEQVINNIVKAVTQAKIADDYGSIPGEVIRQVEEILNPKLPWHQILMDYMSNYAKDDYTWRKPNRKYWDEFYLPGLQSESLDQITAGVDVSGSIDQEDLNAFIAEIRYIWDILKPKKLRLLSFDTKIRDDVTYAEGDSIDNLVLHGGGGTRISHLIETIRDDKPEIAIIFSDLEMSKPYLGDLTTDLFWVKIGDNGITPSQGVIIPYQ